MENTVYDHIDRYLKGELQGEALQDFQRQLASDPALERELQLHKGLRQAVSADVDGFRAKMRQVSREEQSRKKAVRRMSNPRIPYYLMAAAVAILMVIGIAFTVFPGQNDDLSSQDLLAYHLEKPYPDLITSRGDAESDVPHSALKAEAMQLYNKDDFSGAAGLFDQLILKDTTDAGILFYAGFCYLKLDPPHSEKARQAFLRVIEMAGHEYGTPAKWYMGLSYLAVPDERNARRVFEEIQSEKNSYSRKASEILEKLDDEMAVPLHP